MGPKIVGPLTLKQFIIVSLGTMFSFIAYFPLGKMSMPLALALVAIIEGIACTMAFVKVDPAKDAAAENTQSEEKEKIDSDKASGKLQ